MYLGGLKQKGMIRNLCTIANAGIYLIYWLYSTRFNVFVQYIYIYISSHFRPAHQHYTDEAQKAETVPSVVIYIYIYYV